MNIIDSSGDRIGRSNANRDATTGGDGREAAKDCPQAARGAGMSRHSKEIGKFRGRIAALKAKGK